MEAAADATVYESSKSRWLIERLIVGEGLVGYIRELPILHCHEIMVIYPYPFFGGNYPIVFLDNIY